VWLPQGLPTASQVFPEQLDHLKCLVPSGILLVYGHGAQCWQQPRGDVIGGVGGVCGGHGADSSTPSRGEGILEWSQEGRDQHLLACCGAEVGGDLPKTYVGVGPDPRLVGGREGVGVLECMIPEDENYTCMTHPLPFHPADTWQSTSAAVS